MTDAHGGDAYVIAAGRLAPRIAELRGDIERQRNLPDALVATMAEAGFFSMWRAKALGGPELPFADFARVVEELSRADGSVGWCAMIASGFGLLSGHVAEPVAREIFSDPRTIIAGSINPANKAVPAPGGFRLTGRWKFGSFSKHSNWLAGTALVFDGEAPRFTAPGVRDIRLMVFPRAAADIIDTWHVSGLRGTGSNDFEVRDIFVRDDWTAPLGVPRPFQPGALYNIPFFAIFGATLAPVALGIARAAIDAFVALAEAKTPLLTASRLCERPVAQANLGRAEALVRSARPFLLEATEELLAEAARGPTSVRQRALVRLAASHAAVAAAQAVDLVYESAGGTAIMEHNPIERCFRDVHAITQHIATAPTNYELCGRVLLGLDPDRPL